MEEKSTRPCIACEKPSTISIGPADPDVRGIAVCDDCKDQVKQDLILALFEPDEYAGWFEDKYNTNKKE